MKTIVTPVSEMSILQAAELIRAGGLVGMPTETVYGLAADAFNESAVRSIFSAKGRPADNPLIVHISEISQIRELIDGDMPEMAVKLAKAYWPGPLTMIMRRSNRVSDAVTAGLSTVAIRMPSHPWARALIEAAKTPIAAPSANRSGRPSPTTAKHVLDDMDGRIPLILDGGGCEVGVESTVVDVTGSNARVLRPGGVTPEMIAAITGGVEVDGAVLRPLKEGEKPRSPGMKYRHYAPQGELTIFQGKEGAVSHSICARYDEAPAESAILALSRHAAEYGGRRVHLLGDTDQEVAASLFDVLRMLDDEGIAHIYSEAVDASGVGLAVMNRLGRAAAFHIVDANAR